MGLLDNNGFAHLKESRIEPARDLKMAMGLALRESYRALIDKAMYKTQSRLANFDSLKYRNSVYNVILTEIQRAVLNLDIYRNGSVKYNQCDYDDPKNANQILKLDAADGFLQFSSKYQRRHLNYVFLINLIDRALNSTKNVNQDLLSSISPALLEQGLDIVLIDQSFGDISRYCKELGLYDYLKNLRGAHNVAMKLNGMETKNSDKSEQGWKEYCDKINKFVKNLPGAKVMSSTSFWQLAPRQYNYDEDEPHALSTCYCYWSQDYSHRNGDATLKYELEIRKAEDISNPEVD